MVIFRIAVQLLLQAVTQTQMRSNWTNTQATSKLRIEWNDRRHSCRKSTNSLIYKQKAIKNIGNRTIINANIYNHQIVCVENLMMILFLFSRATPYMLVQIEEFLSRALLVTIIAFQNPAPWFKWIWHSMNIQSLVEPVSNFEKRALTFLPIRALQYILDSKFGVSFHAQPLTLSVWYNWFYGRLPINMAYFNQCIPNH